MCPDDPPRHSNLNSNESSGASVRSETLLGYSNATELTAGSARIDIFSDRLNVTEPAAESFPMILCWTARMCVSGQLMSPHDRKVGKMALVIFLSLLMCRLDRSPVTEFIEISDRPKLNSPPRSARRVVVDRHLKELVALRGQQPEAILEDFDTVTEPPLLVKDPSPPRLEGSIPSVASTDTSRTLSKRKGTLFLRLLKLKQS